MGFGLGQLLRAELRQLEFDVVHVPNPPEDPTNEAHCHIVGNNSRQMARRLAEMTEVVVQPSALS